MNINLSINQGSVITNLNKYLQWHNLPLRLGSGGVCQGLSTVHTKYFLESRSDEFLEMLRYVAGKKHDSEMDMALNHFVVEILLSHNPGIFDKQLRQRNTLELLNYGENPIESAFSMNLVTVDENWVDILKQLALKDNEVMNLQSFCHAVSVTKKNDCYIIYDPSFGFKEFSTEEELIHDLHQNVFHYERGAIGMAVQVITNTQAKTDRRFPVLTDLYEKYLSKDNVNDVARFDIEKNPVGYSEAISPQNILFAACHNDAALVKKSINMGAEAIELAIHIAIDKNADNAFKVLLEHAKLDDEVIREIIHLALRSGSNKIYDTLIKHEYCSEVIADIVKTPGNALVYTHLAAIGGHVELLKKIMKRFNAQPTDILIKLDKKDAIMAAIDGGSMDCVELLLKTLSDAGHRLNEEQRLQYLMQAIHIKQPNIILSSHLLTKIPLKDESFILKLLIETLKHGREDAFDALLTHQPYKYIVTQAIDDQANTAAYLQATATSGNPRLLEKIISKFPMNDSEIANKIFESNAINVAGSLECGVLLKGKLDAEREKNKPYFYNMMMFCHGLGVGLATISLMPIVIMMSMMNMMNMLFEVDKSLQQYQANTNQAEKKLIAPYQCGFMPLMQAITSRLHSFTDYLSKTLSMPSIPEVLKEDVINVRP